MSLIRLIRRIKFAWRVKPEDLEIPASGARAILRNLDEAIEILGTRSFDPAVEQARRGLALTRAIVDAVEQDLWAMAKAKKQGGSGR